MIEWILTNDFKIEFNIKPDVGIRVPLPCMDKKRKKEILKKPFVNRKELDIVITKFGDYKRYEFLIEAGYYWDGSTIPRLAWTLLGISKEDTRCLIASLIHDTLCENHNYIDNDRKLSTEVFKELIIQGGVGEIKADLMARCVDNWQKIAGKWKRNINTLNT